MERMKRSQRPMYLASSQVLSLVGLATTLAGCPHPPDAYYRPMDYMSCRVTRKECTTFDRAAGRCTAVSSDSHSFTGDMCFDRAHNTTLLDDLCAKQFCTPGVDAPGTCSATFDTTRPTGSTDGICATVSAPAGNASGTWHLHGEDCSTGTCVLQNQDIAGCVDVTSTAAINQLASPASWISRAIHIDPLGFNASGCPIKASVRFGFASAPLGTASGNGNTVAATALRGQADVVQTCDFDSCLPSSLSRFTADLADITVAGNTLTRLAVATTQAAPVKQFVDSNGAIYMGIASGALEFRLSGKLNGADSFFIARNTSTWRLDMTASTFRLRGTLGPDNLAAGGSSVPVTVTADVSATPLTGNAATCANLSERDRLFGFEDLANWTSTQATVSLATTPLTQGCAAVAVRGQGYFAIDGSGFSTSGLAINTAASVDLYIPGPLANPFWNGQAQMFLSCPSATFNHQFVGQVELTGKPINQYSTLRFPLTSQARTVLAQTLNDCSWELALNVNNTTQTWIFDNFRFTP
jgi:hypothetical protein